MNTYTIKGHERLRQLRELREQGTHTEYYQYNPSLVYTAQCGYYTMYGHLPTLDELDNRKPSYTRLVDYA